jgi:hypothetical protein
MKRSIFIGQMFVFGMLAFSNVAAETPGKKEVLEALGKGTLSGDPSVQVQIESWKHHNNSCLALIYAVEGVDREVIAPAKLSPTLALLETTGKTLKIIAKKELKGSDFDEKLPDDDEDIFRKSIPQAVEGASYQGFNCLGIKLDLAPYRINPTEVAIGLRAKIHEVFPNGEADWEQLSLFRVEDLALKKIISCKMESSSEDRTGSALFAHHNNLQISTRKTGGFFDLIFVEKVKKTPMFEDSDMKPSTETRKHRFVWKKDAYEEVK